MVYSEEANKPSLKGGKSMKHNLKISVSDEGTTRIVRCKKTSIREKFLNLLFGESKRVTVIIPGDTVSGLSITEEEEGGENVKNEIY